MKQAVRKASLALVAICCVAATTVAGIEVLKPGVNPGIEVLGIEVLSPDTFSMHAHIDAALEGGMVYAFCEGVCTDAQPVCSDGYVTLNFINAASNCEISLTQDGIEVLRYSFDGIEVLAVGTGILELD